MTRSGIEAAITDHQLDPDSALVVDQLALFDIAHPAHTPPVALPTPPAEDTRKDGGR